MVMLYQMNIPDPEFHLSRLPVPQSIVVGGPSFGGKTTAVEILVEKHVARRGITCTTRPRRAIEQEDAYDFLTDVEFDHLKATGEMAEETQYIGNKEDVHRNPIRYGILRHRIDEAMQADLPTVWVLDSRGVQKMRELIPGTVSIFLWASLDTLIARGGGRAGETSESIAKRLSDYDRELRLGMDVFDVHLCTDTMSPIEVAIRILTASTTHAALLRRMEVRR
jgi:guanylate kinase